MFSSTLDKTLNFFTNPIFYPLKHQFSFIYSRLITIKRRVYLSVFLNFQCFSIFEEFQILSVGREKYKDKNAKWSPEELS